MPGKRFGATKPVYVLTSARTFSGGEDLAYTLQTHQRASIVGEVTAGGAHPVVPHEIDAGLHVLVPWGRSISPITNGNWEGTGVQPDIASAAELRAGACPERPGGSETAAAEVTALPLRRKVWKCKLELARASFAQSVPPWARNWRVAGSAGFAQRR